MIIDTTRMKVSQCRDELLEFIYHLREMNKDRRPYQELARTVITTPGMLTSCFVSCWEKQTGLKFDWSRIIVGGEAPSLVMAELELEANVEQISEQLRWAMDQRDVGSGIKDR